MKMVYLDGVMNKVNAGRWCKAMNIEKRYPSQSWYMVGYSQSGNNGMISVANMYFPKDMIGKKIRLRVEVIDNE
jgi:hypothetical protein